MHVLICVQQEAHPQLEPDSRLGSKLTGIKNRFLKPSSTSAAGAHASTEGPASVLSPSPSPLDSAYDFGALATDRQDRGHVAEPSHSSTAGGLPQQSARHGSLPK